MTRVGSGYNSPLVILMALALLLLFIKYVRLPMWLARLATVISPLTFGVYILHETTSFGRLIYKLPQIWLLSVWSEAERHPMVVIFVTAVFCFLVCASIDGLRRIVFSRFSKRVLSLVALYDKRLEMFCATQESR